MNNTCTSCGWTLWVTQLCSCSKSPHRHLGCPLHKSNDRQTSRGIEVIIWYLPLLRLRKPLQVPRLPSIPSSMGKQVAITSSGRVFVLAVLRGKRLEYHGGASCSCSQRRDRIPASIQPRRAPINLEGSGRNIQCVLGICRSDWSYLQYSTSGRNSTCCITEGFLGSRLSFAAVSSLGLLDHTTRKAMFLKLTSSRSRKVFDGPVTSYL